MIFHRELIDDVRDEIEPLLTAHYDEIAADKHVIKLAPDWGRYEQMERDNALRIFTARDDETPNMKLVGYSVFFLTWHPHYVENLFAQNDIIFLDRDYRGMNGIRLIRYSEAQLVKDRVDKILWHVKVSADWRKVLTRMGYVEQDIILGKVI